MNISDFDFNFPQGLIARYPSEIRGESKLLIAHRKTQEIHHTSFSKICDFLEVDDCLVVNQSRVFPARLFGQKETGGKVEFLLLENISENRWKCLAFPLKRLRTGVRIFFPLDHSELNCHSEPKARNLLSAAVIDVQEAHVVIDFNTEGVPPAGEFQKIPALIEKIGHIPLPPYLRRKAEPIDRERYQTIFANQMGAVAAPTAGLHWTEGLIREVREKGVEVVPITLHVGQGTFAVIREKQIQNHMMHAEYVEISEEAARKINAAKRVVAVGTTVVRALESQAKEGEVNSARGKTDLYIYPGYRFQIVDALQTNFHRPRSSLYVMVSAFAGLDFIRRCYEDAFGRGCRLFSYGDTMLIL